MKMQKSISSMNARQKLGQIMNEVSLRGDDYIIKRAGKPMVAMISMETYEMIKRNRIETRQALQEIHEEMKNENPDEVEALIAEAVNKTRKKAKRK